MNIDLSPPTLWGRQPVVIVAAVRALILAVAAFLASLEPAQIGAVMLAVEAVLAAITHQSVFAPATVDRLTAPTTRAPDPGRSQGGGEGPDVPS